MAFSPLISVIVPSYNQGAYLAEALDSVIAQNYTNWECLVMDDGSTDNTKEVALRYETIDRRIKYHWYVNGGVSAIRNRGLEIAKGEFILPLDADDKISSRYMELAIEVFRCKPETLIVYGMAQLFGKAKGEWKLKCYDYNNLKYENMIYCSFFCRKSEFERIDGYDESMLRGLEDWELLLRLLTSKSIVYQIPELCFFYRIKKVSRSTKITSSIQIDIYDYMVRKNINIYMGDANPILMCNNVRSESGSGSVTRRSLEYRIGKFILVPRRWWRNIFK